MHEENYSFDGMRKIHAAMRRAGWEVGRDQVARLMRKAGLREAIRGCRPITTTPAAKGAGRFLELAQRRFRSDAPNRLWVADITFVPTSSGFAYVAFVTDASSRKIVGWNVTSRLTTEALPLQALEMASWAAMYVVPGLEHPADHGSQNLSLRYSERLTDLEIQASTGSVGDSYDNALAEAINWLFNTELIKARKP